MFIKPWPISQYDLYEARTQKLFGTSEALIELNLSLCVAVAAGELCRCIEYACAAAVIAAQTLRMSTPCGHDLQTYRRP